jgi:hypothetical protein
MCHDIRQRVERLESMVGRLLPPAEARLDVLAYWVSESFASATELQRIQANIVRLNEELSTLYRQLSDQIAAAVAAMSGESQSNLLSATQQMQETQMSFNLQYLALQDDMQNENRQFTMVSNIMKTKHDTVKDALGNIR